MKKKKQRGSATAYSTTRFWCNVGELLRQSRQHCYFPYRGGNVKRNKYA